MMGTRTHRLPEILMTMSRTEASTPPAERDRHYRSVSALADLPYKAARAAPALREAVESGVLTEDGASDVEDLLDCIGLLPERFG